MKKTFIILLAIILLTLLVVIESPSLLAQTINKADSVLEPYIFQKGMNIDADGAPKAYNADDSIALDYLKNAGKPGNWWALVTDNGLSSGNPVVQTKNDPAEGFYISMTSLEDKTRAVNDPKRYVDATQIPYIVLSKNKPDSIKLGDLAIVYNTKNNKLSGAIYADNGHDTGEGSIALAQALGIDSNAKNGGIDEGIVYIVFPNSGNGKPRSLEEINAEAFKQFEAWGGMKKLKDCLIELNQ